MTTSVWVAWWAPAHSRHATRLPRADEWCWVCCGESYADVMRRLYRLYPVGQGWHAIRRAGCPPGVLHAPNAGRKRAPEEEPCPAD